MPSNDFLAIHSTERLAMQGPITVVELHVHLGRPGPILDIGDHALNYTKIEFHGKGVFTMLRHGQQLWRFEQ